MKERVLTNAELGDYAYVFTCTFAEVNTSPHTYGCTTEGEQKACDAMAYYWDDNCHSNVYGYSSGQYNCDNKNSYTTSKVKEFLEGTYINTLGADNLKEVDGYKIRLIKVDELVSNLGYTKRAGTGIYDYYLENSSAPTWVYQNFGGDQNDIQVNAYWTMTPHPTTPSGVWLVTSSGGVGYSYVHNGNTFGIRPVINLLKSAIE